jgi:hypothetical protein
MNKLMMICGLVFSLAVITPIKDAHAEDVSGFFGPRFQEHWQANGFYYSVILSSSDNTFSIKETWMAVPSVEQIIGTYTFATVFACSAEVPETEGCKSSRIESAEEQFCSNPDNAARCPD